MRATRTDATPEVKGPEAGGMGARATAKLSTQAHAPEPGRGGSAACDARRFARLRWRCRRGMLENDLILARFLDARCEAISEAEEAALCRLLDLTDNELWDLLSGRAEAADGSLQPILRALRSA